jgi:hypothetical protein
MGVAPSVYTTAELVSAMTGGEVPPETVLPDWIDAASEEIDRRTGMVFCAKQFEETVEGDGGDSVFLDAFPLIEVLSVEIDGAVIPPQEYSASLRTGIIRLKTRWAAGSITVKGVQGYSKVPALVRKIASILAAKTALSARFEPLVDSEHIGDFSQTRSFKKLNDELDRAWDALGRKYRIYTV